MVRRSRKNPDDAVDNSGFSQAIEREYVASILRKVQTLTNEGMLQVRSHSWEEPGLDSMVLRIGKFREKARFIKVGRT